MPRTTWGFEKLRKGFGAGGGVETVLVERRVLEALGLTGGELQASTIRDYREVRVPTFWLEMELNREWCCAFRLAMQSGAVVVSELRIFPLDEEALVARRGTWLGALLGPKAPVPPQGVTARLLRQVRLGDLQSAATVFLNWVRANAADTLPEEWSGPPPPRARQPSERQRRRPAPTDLYLAHVAARYVSALLTTRRPIVAVAAQLKITAKDASRYVILARRRKLLTDAPGQGKRGGRLTPSARRLLHPSPRARTTSKETR